MDGWMGRINGWDGWMDGWMDGCVDGMDKSDRIGWTSERTNVREDRKSEIASDPLVMETFQM